ncbi:MULTISPECIES: hypothetical protein [Photorhabdus]|uniref:hypothetical protein n=1 Tax=Photorhabdus TaxID=29487 RepID=UPI00073385E7|nr:MULTISPECIES: hypothetical protein [Photorhabdus]AWK41850.1 hypothetical protein A4R40_10310 [Photorhabdus laumondii subsp. laumondii]AXG42713.1 hypothetical protein PluDJC_10990 [Photorhabdus laumondii subsp. laumondii]KTL61671.1 hypothetical protein AA106_22410 [Photorhabdus laumondii subsp. laumondii]MCC8389167.1 hypothetical protein [Photorhabdus laumondii]MCZ1249845.1 hypothetical protein [Photorhabdus laumondii subsp. laumondii]
MSIIVEAHYFDRKLGVCYWLVFNSNMKFNMLTLTADIISGMTILEECSVVITATYSENVAMLSSRYFNRASL